MKKILIIGNGLSAWSVANTFANKNVHITIIGKRKSILGAQLFQSSRKKLQVN